MEKAEKKQRYKRGENPNSKKNLIQFEKGVSGNPNGVPKGTKHRATLLREVVDIIAKFQNPITKTNESMPVELRMEYAIVGKALKGDVQAYREVKDSLYGKIPNKDEHSGPDGGPIETVVVLPK